MKFNPDIHHRRTIRLKGYDYSQAGAYFVTICTHGRDCLFGEIMDGEMRMNRFGHIAAAEWVRTAKLRSKIELGEYVVMPNHFHGIVVITDESSEGKHCGDEGTARRAPTVEQFGKPVVGSLPTVLRSFKSAVTKCINELKDSPGMQVWQRNYHEHVIRNEVDYIRIVEYVTTNPQRWIEDTLHPDNVVVADGNAGGVGNFGIDGNIVGARRAVPLRPQPRGRHE